MDTLTFVLVALMAIGAIAQGTSYSMATTSPTSSGAISAQTTITALVNSLGAGLAGSIVSANPCDTTMVLRCAACSAIPDGANLALTVTQGPTFYELAYSTSVVEGTGSVFESCAIFGPSGSFTSAVCTGAVVVGVLGVSKTLKSSQTTVQGTQYGFIKYGQVPITAGAEKLPQGSASCTGTSSGSAAAPTGVKKEIYKVVVPVGFVLAAGGLM